MYLAVGDEVLEQNYTANVVAADECVRVKNTKSTGTRGLIHAKQYAQYSIHWNRKGKQMVIEDSGNPFEYILSAINFTERFCLEQKVPMSLYDLHVNSDLDSADGKKYGLGSSAAVTVATVKAILNFYGLHCTKDLIFKLSAISHYSVQGNGSAGDIAASVYGGWLAYQTFDKAWLKTELATKSLSEVLNEAWPGLKIQLLTPPEGLNLVIGWSQKPASTSQLVDKTNAKKKFIRTQYDTFLDESRKCVLDMIRGFNEKNISLIQKQIRLNRQLLKDFASLNHIAIEIPRLTKLINIAEQFNGAAKTSGAGNGDCGIVIADEKTDIEEMKNNWRKNGIMPLHFLVHSIA